MKKIIIGLIVLVLILAVVLGSSFIKEYRKGGGIDPELRCIQYTESCRCAGFLSVMESYPAKYKCGGVEFCRDINMTECK